MPTLLNNNTLNTSPLSMCGSFHRATSFVDHSTKGAAQHIFVIWRNCEMSQSVFLLSVLNQLL